MKVGIVSEGHTDRHVLKNILKGISNIQFSEVIAIRPEDSFDETHLAHLDPDGFGSWTNVRNECINREKISQFLSIEGHDWIVVHIDSLQCDEYEITRPNRNSQTYSIDLRELIIDKINEWLNNNFTHNMIYAISIEEIESWVLTIYTQRNTTSFLDPKSRLKTALSKKGENTSEIQKKYSQFSTDFSKKRNHQKHQYRYRNESLDLFCSELENKIPFIE